MNDIQQQKLTNYERKLNDLATAGNMDEFKAVNEERIAFVNKIARDIEISERAIDFFKRLPDMEEDEEESDLEHHGLLGSELI